MGIAEARETQVVAANRRLHVFEADPDREFIECFQLPTDRWTRGGLNRMQLYHFYDQFDARKRMFDLPANQGIVSGLVRVQRLLGIRRELPGGFEPYHGAPCSGR